MLALDEWTKEGKGPAPVHVELKQHAQPDCQLTSQEDECLLWRNIPSSQGSLLSSLLILSLDVRID